MSGRDPRHGEARALQAPRPRLMTRADAPAVLEMERRSFQEIPAQRQSTEDMLQAHVDAFPEGQWVVELDGRVLGSCTNLLTSWTRATRQHTWMEITGGGRLRTHDPTGDVLYGTQIMVHPDARRRGVGRMLFQRRFGFVVERRLRAFVTGGRLPGYGRHAERMKCREYVEAVQRGDLVDPVLTPELKWGLTPRGVLCDYVFDPPSLHHATLVAWENPERSPREVSDAP